MSQPKPFRRSTVTASVAISVARGLLHHAVGHYLLFATVRANGQVIWPLIILFISLFGVRLGFAYGMRPYLGSDAIWYSFPAAMVATMVMAFLLYRFGNWRGATPWTSRPRRTRPPPRSIPRQARPAPRPPVRPRLCRNSYSSITSSTPGTMRNRWRAAGPTGASVHSSIS